MSKPICDVRFPKRGNPYRVYSIVESLLCTHNQENEFNQFKVQFTLLSNKLTYDNVQEMYLEVLTLAKNYVEIIHES